MVGPGSYYKLWGFDKDMLINDTNVIYTFDYFEPAAFIFHDTKAEQPILTYPGSYPCSALYKGFTKQCCPKGAATKVTFDREWHRANLANWATALRDAADVPIFMNQWSVVRAVTEQAGRYKYVADIAALLQSMGIGWAWWTFRGNEPKPGSSAFVYYASNGTVVQDEGLIGAVKPYMANSDPKTSVGPTLNQ